MSLSDRALKFLQGSEREVYDIREADIRQIFLASNAPVFEPLIDFQLRFGGYTFYAGRAPITFSLLKGLGRYPGAVNTAYVDFDRGDSDTPQYFFDCASSDYQMQFFLDEQGTYYEDYEATASCFEKVVERLALWQEMRLRDGYEKVFEHHRFKTDNLHNILSLDIIAEASDAYTSWYSNEFMYMNQSNGLTTLILSNRFENANLLLSLV